jgi:porin
MLRLDRRIHLAALLVVVAGLRSAPAQESPVPTIDPATDWSGFPETDYCECGACACPGDECVCLRPTLTGDWHGCRSCLQESGITFAGRVTHFAFGIDGGINTPVAPPLEQGNAFKYTGRGEYDLIFDLEKFGGLPKGTLLVRAEHWYGEFGNVSLRTGAFAPAVFPALLPPRPNDPGVPYITNFLFTQPLSEQLVVFAGKKDVLGSLDQDDFAGGDGTDQFINQALIANPAFLLGLPYTSFTAGVVMPREWGLMTAFVYDPQDRTADFFRLGDLFSKGVIVGGEVKVKTNFFCMPGTHHAGALWKHKAQTDLRFAEPPPGEYPYPTVPGFPTLMDAYTIYYGFDQYLVEYSDEPRRGWGLFGRASISDANPTPIQYFLSAGLGGSSPFAWDRGDTFGIGWYFVGASDEFGPLPQFLFGPRDGTGVELYYNFQVTPWLNVTPDFQYIHPGAGAIADDSFLYGLRINMIL